MADGSEVAGAPLALDEEVARQAVVERVARRWDQPVTIVVGGAGFGKSTAVAQAVRANLAEPLGVDRWVGCAPGHEQAERLADAIVAACGGAAGGGDPLLRVVDALDSASPVDVCLVLDDSHQITDGSSSADLLAGLVRNLPAHAHLLLVGRCPPPLPLARLRAAGGVVEVGEDLLAFSAAEVAELARRLGRLPPPAIPYDGWPALVRLALAADTAVAVDYVREEVLAGLSGDERSTLLALATVGTASAVDVASISGATIDLAGLAARLPLVRYAGDGRFEAHEMWLEAIERSVAPVEVAAVRRRSVDLLVDAGDLPRAGALAISSCDWDALGRVALELLATTVSALPTDIAAGWLAAVPERRRAEPVFELLAATLAATDDYTDPGVDGRIDGVAAAFGRTGDPYAAVVALAIGTVVAQSRGDGARIVELAHRAATVEGADDHPVVRLAARSLAAVVAEMGGDPEGALVELAAAPLDDVPPAVALSAQRFRWHCLLLAGRADEAIAVSDERLTTDYDRSWWRPGAVARWMAGDPDGFLHGHEPRRYAAAAAAPSARDTFVRTALYTVVLTSLGRRPDALLVGERWRPGAELPDNARDAALVTNARAALAVADHDETGAAAEIDRFLAAHPVTEAFGERSLRRFLALGYVLDVRLRQVWDAASLGPSHERVREVARLVVAARSGRRRAVALRPPEVVTALPLPWSAELACRLSAGGDDLGGDLAAWLVDHVGPAARSEIRRLTEAQGALAPAAAAILRTVPSEPLGQLQVDVLGPLQVRARGEEAVRPELRRARVREMLSVLVVERRVGRERLADLLWPELDPGAAGRNLRVTLTYLRRLLEPDRAPGEASFHVRADAAQVSLFGSDHLVVDAWELERLVGEAGRAREAADVGTAIALLERATGLWRGSPVPDLTRLDALVPDVVRLQRLQLDALVELGELQLARGRGGAALATAERALAVDPFCEAAHRLALGAAIGLRDPERVAAVRTRTVSYLEEVGAAPDGATAILLQRAAVTAG